MVRATAMEFTAPVTSRGHDVEVIACPPGTDQCHLGYRCAVSSGAQEVPVAQGTRVVVRRTHPDSRTRGPIRSGSLFDWLAAGAQGPRP